MYLKKIILTNFKNYEGGNIEFSPTINCIVGLNGMGKTNLLDAIYYLCMCKSHFGTNDVFLTLHEKEFFRIEGEFKNQKKNYKVAAKFVNSQKKEMELNGVVYPKLADHIGAFPIVMLTPYDIDLALEGSEVRRRFMDNTLSQIDTEYLNALVLYNRILLQRNAALKKMGEIGKVDHELLDIFDEQMSQPTSFIYNKRKVFSERFLETFQTYYRTIANGQEVVAYEYHSQLEKEEFGILLKENRQKDITLQRSTVGIHRDDLVFKIEDFPLKKFASQGQLKSFILALKLAQYDLLKKEKDCSPLLLLDDIFDKLDRQRVLFLIKLLFDKSFGQIFFTDTHESRLAEILKEFGKEFKQVVIKNGRFEDLRI